MDEMVGMKMAPPISLSDFLIEYKETLKNDKNELDDFYNTDEESLAEECSIEKLEQDDDPYVNEFEPGFSERNRVCADVLNKKAYELQTYKSLHNYKKNVVKNPFQRTRDSYKAPDIIPKTSTNENDIENEILIWVRVYRPARATHIGQSLESPVFAEEFACLGSNLLTELRDKISCICNGKRFFDISEDPQQPVMEKDADPAYFFITDTFYNDMRSPNNADYSETVITWAKRAAGVRNIKFKVAKMEETRFIDLTVSMGFPQQYQHHGNCEHIFTFSQVELLTTHMKLYGLIEYPFLMSFNSFNSRLCNMCSHCVYSFVVEGSNRQLHEPAYLCEKCFLRYHYLDGKKIGTFTAYRIKNNITHLDENLDNECDIFETNDNTSDDEITSERTNKSNCATKSDLKKTENDTYSELKSKRVYTQIQVNTKEKDVLQKQKRVYKKKKTLLQKKENPETAFSKSYKTKNSTFLDTQLMRSKMCTNEKKQNKEKKLEVPCQNKVTEKKKPTSNKSTPTEKNAETLQRKYTFRSKSNEKNNLKSTDSFVNDEEPNGKNKYTVKEPFQNNSKSEKVNSEDYTEFITEPIFTEEANSEQREMQHSSSIVQHIPNDDDVEFIDETLSEKENSHMPAKMNLHNLKRKNEDQDLIEQVLADLIS